MPNELTQEVQVYINSLKDDKQNYVNWLDSKGVSVSTSDTFTTLNTKAAQNISNGAMPNEITENGEYDVTAYETATVNVAGNSKQLIGSRIVFNKAQSISKSIGTTIILGE